MRRPGCGLHKQFWTAFSLSCRTGFETQCCIRLVGHWRCRCSLRSGVDDLMKWRWTFSWNLHVKRLLLCWVRFWCREPACQLVVFSVLASLILGRGSVVCFTMVAWLAKIEVIASILLRIMEKFHFCDEKYLEECKWSTTDITGPRWNVPFGTDCSNFILRNASPDQCTIRSW